ncbi:hypothetical protein D3C80_1889640 [compost metagenome]
MQAAVRAEADFLAAVISPDFQQVLLLAHLLAGKPDAQAQHALLLVVPFHSAQFDKAQWSCAGVAVDGLGGEA